MSSHILIAGPGRSGTTFLVKLLDALEFDTGLHQLTYIEDAHAGYESDPLDPEAAHVVKNPSLNVRLRHMLDAGELDPTRVDWLLVPMRDLESAAASRVKTSLAMGGIRVPGGLVGTIWPRRQGKRLAEETYSLFETAALYELPLIVLEYPKFVIDTEYAFRRLKPILYNRSYRDFAAAWHSVVEETLVRTGPIEFPYLATVRCIPLQLRWLGRSKPRWLALRWSDISALAKVLRKRVREGFAFGKRRRS